MIHCIQHFTYFFVPEWLTPEQEAYSEEYVILAWVISALVIFTVILLIVLILNRIIKHRKEQKRAYWKSVYEERITEYVIEGEMKNAYQISLPGSKLKKELLMEILLKLKHGLYGYSDKFVRNVYMSTGLYQYSLKKLKKRNWSKRAEGLFELSHFGIFPDEDILHKQINSPKIVLRTEATIASLRLSTDFIEQFKKLCPSQFTRYEEIMVFYIIQKLTPDILNKGVLPSFAQLLDSPQNAIVAYALKMIRQMQEIEAKEKIFALSLHEHSANNIRYETYKTLSLFGTIYPSEVLKKLRTAFRKEKHVELQNTIITAMGEVIEQDPSFFANYELFLYNCIFNEKAEKLRDYLEVYKTDYEKQRILGNIYDQKIAAMLVFYKSDSKNWEKLLKQINEDPELTAMAKHIADSRINTILN